MWCLLPLSLFAQTDTPHQLRLQEFVQNIRFFNRLYPQEKVWLHCDNTAYFQGDTIWFAAYVTSAETLRPAEDLSKVLYVELLNEVGEVVSTQRLPIENGRCHGQIPLNTELETHFLNDREQNLSYPINPRNGNLCIPLPSGYYEVRAYTRAMLNWGSDICFSRVFPVFDTPEWEGDYSQLAMENHDKRIIDRIRPKTAKDDRLNVDFYPEGGNIVCGLPCRVAYKVTDREGRNLHAHCQLLADDDPITGTETVHDGMGSFSLLPQDGVKYKLRVKTDKYSRTFKLPDTRLQGVMLAVDALEKDSVRIAIAATESLQHKAMGMSITCRGELQQFKAYSLSNRPTRLPAIAKEGLSPGVNQVTLFDADGQVYAERLFFVHDTAVVGRKLVEYPNISNLIQGLDPLHDHLTDGIGGDFPFQGVLNGLLNLGGDPIQVLHIHLPLVESANHSVEDLVPVEGLTGAVPLHNNNGQALHHFIGGETALAVQAFPTAANALAVLGMTGIHDFTFLVSAKWTFHRKRPPFLYLHNIKFIISAEFAAVQHFFTLAKCESLG